MGLGFYLFLLLLGSMYLFEPAMDDPNFRPFFPIVTCRFLRHNAHITVVDWNGDWGKRMLGRVWEAPIETYGAGRTEGEADYYFSSSVAVVANAGFFL